MHHIVIRVLSLVLSLALVFPCVSSAKKTPKKPGRAADPLDGLIKFTPNFLKEHNLSGDSLKALQYYSGNAVTLYRLVNPADERVASGKLVTTSGGTYDVVVIKRGTPGILTRVSESDGAVSSIWISFEPNCSVRFVASSRGKFSASEPFLMQREYCGSEYDVAGCAAGAGDSEWKELAHTLHRTGETPAYVIGTQSLPSIPGSCNDTYLFVDFKTHEPSGTVRVVPGQTLQK